MFSGRRVSLFKVTPGPKPEVQLGAITKMMLDTSAQMGEMLAIRRQNLDVTSPSLNPPGRYQRQSEECSDLPARPPKTDRFTRIVAISTYEQVPLLGHLKEATSVKQVFGLYNALA